MRALLSNFILKLLRKRSVVVFFSCSLFDESRTLRSARRRIDSGAAENVDVEYVQVRHGLAEFQAILSELGWFREVILLLHFPDMRLHDVPEDLHHVDVVLTALKEARPYARVLIWDYLSDAEQVEARGRVERILGNDRILTAVDLQIDPHDHALPRTRFRRLSAALGLL